MSPEPTEPAPLTETEPVAVYQSVATLICAALLAFGIAVDPNALAVALLTVAGVVAQVVAAVKARSKVTPVA